MSMASDTGNLLVRNISEWTQTEHEWYHGHVKSLSLCLSSYKIFFGNPFFRITKNPILTNKTYLQLYMSEPHCSLPGLWYRLPCALVTYARTILKQEYDIPVQCIPCVELHLLHLGEIDNNFDPTVIFGQNICYRNISFKPRVW